MTALESGPAMRVQRAAEGVLLLSAVLSQDVRPAWVVFASLGLQVLSPRLALLALLVAAVRPAPERHRLGDLFYDLRASRGSSAVSVAVMAVALLTLALEVPVLGWVLLACPTASLLLVATVGFCAGCGIYVGLCDLAARLGARRDRPRGTHSIPVEDLAPHRQPELRPPP